MAAVGASLDPWGPYGRCRGVAGPLGFVWPLWGRGLSLGPCIAAVGAWPLSWAPYGWRGDVARIFARMTAVKTWPVPLASSCHREGVARPLVLYGRLGGVARPLGPV